MNSWVWLVGEHEMKQWLHAKLHTVPATWNHNVSSERSSTRGITGLARSFGFTESFGLTESLGLTELVSRSAAIGADTADRFLAGGVVARALGLLRMAQLGA